MHEGAEHLDDRAQTEPKSFKATKDVLEWQATMWVEYDSIMRNNTWELVDRPKKREVIGTKQVYKLKFRSDGNLEKHKARPVVKGMHKLKVSTMMRRLPRSPGWLQ